MTLNDLKTGMIVTNRKGEEMIVLRNVHTGRYMNCDYFVDLDKEEQDNMSHYTDDMKSKKGLSEYDIVKVEMAGCPTSSVHSKFRKYDRTVIWTEPCAKKLTVSEIEKLLGYKVEIISEEE